MIKSLMLFLGLMNFLINIGGLISAFVFPPYVFGVAGISLIPLFLVSYIELSKKKILL